VSCDFRPTPNPRTGPNRKRIMEDQNEKPDAVTPVASDDLFGVVGSWVSVQDRMPDDDMTVLVWSSHSDEATIAAHDTEALDRRKDSGWIHPDGHVVFGVTHFCEDILPPNVRSDSRDLSR